MGQMNYKKIMKKTFLLSLILVPLSLSLIPLMALAQSTVTISPGIPGTNPTTAAGTSPGAFVANFYQFALLIGGILAFGAIVYGGVLHAVSAGNPSRQSEGKKWIWSALTGLLLLAGAYIVLYTINPNLLNLNLPTLTPISIPTPAGGGTNTGNPGAGNVAGQGLNTAQVMANFNAAGNITVKPGADVNGLLLQTVQDIDNLEASCKQAQGSCPIVITSGTDSHAAGTGHALGYKADLRTSSALDAFITSLPQAGSEQINGVTVPLYAFGGGTIADERNVPGVAPHWDLSSGGGHQ
jgi:hypothetical protein